MKVSQTFCHVCALFFLIFATLNFVRLSGVAGFFTNIQFRNFEVKRIKAYSITSSFLCSHKDQSIYKTDLHKVQKVLHLCGS